MPDGTVWGAGALDPAGGGRPPAGVLASTYWALPGPGRAAEHAALGVSAAALLGWGPHVASVRGRRPRRGGPGSRISGEAARGAAWALVAVGLLLWSTGFLQVWHDGAGDWQVLLWRVLHLSAFAAWFWGAVWNVVIAVRAARENLTLPVVTMANAQLERFRQIGQVALPLIVATGLLQVWDYVGFTRWAVEGPFGHFILIQTGPGRVTGGHLQYLPHVVCMFTDRWDVRPGRPRSRTAQCGFDAGPRSRPM